MGEPAKRNATYDDLLALPDDARGELIYGSLYVQPSPAPPHGSSQFSLSVELGGPFQKAPTNKGRVMAGSPTVFINGKPAARVGDMCMTCGDPVDAPTAAVVTVGPVTVMIG
jgi:uncharacterized Zn-binding protein involved in type VI secretion